MAGDVSTYIGKNYPIVSYASNQSVDDVSVQIAALSAEKLELESAFTEFMLVLAPLINDKTDAIIAPGADSYARYEVSGAYIL